MGYHIDREILIQAPIETLFRLVSEPDHLHDINPDITVLGHAPSTVGGYDTDWEYSFGAIKLNGRSQVITYNAPHQLIVETHGGIPSHWHWQFEKTAQGTRVLVNLDYEVPAPLQFMGHLLVKRNQQAVDMQMNNLKRIAEGEGEGEEMGR